MTVKRTFDSWIIYTKPNPQARLRLFCFPCAGSIASAYRIWPNHLPADVEVCLVQLPGRGSRLKEKPFTSLSALVQTLLPILQPYLNLPFVFFGHSMGAVLGFEIARQLRQQVDLSPVHLFVCSSPAPHRSNRNPPIHVLPEAEFVAELGHRYNAIPQSILQDNKLMQLFLPVLRADLTMLETYVYTVEKPLDCPISAFGGLEDRVVSSCELAEWRDQTRSSFTLKMFPGDHFFLHSTKSPFLEVLSQQMFQVLEYLFGGHNSMDEIGD